jgi:ABC-2 type transport system permease protein
MIRLADLPNVLAVARRELLVRMSTRSFVISTLVLVVVAAGVGLAPVAIGYLDPGTSHVAVYVDAPDLAGDPVATLDGLLNPQPTESSTPPFEVRRSTDLAADRQAVLDGDLTALLAVDRDPQGTLAFTVYTKEADDSATAMISRQAATAIAVNDRLGRLGLSSADQAAVFAPASVTVRSPDLTAPVQTSRAISQQIADTTVIVALEMFLLLALLMYGTWIAQGVVEEKSSRMMEIILSAARPVQLLTGKVLGISTAALLQFGAVLVIAGLALVAQGPIARVALGSSAASGMPAGLTPGLLAGFSVFFVLGFVLYATLFAAAGSLVSRQEDVSPAIMPMTLLVTGAYLVALYASLGTFEMASGWVVALSWLPFTSPYVMVARLNAGTAGPLEAVGAALLLVLAIGLVAWIAARIYAAGVLMYGQKPNVRRMLRALREARS